METDVSEVEIVRRIGRLSQSDLAEVARFIEFLEYKAAQDEPIQPSSGEHPAFGIWADRTDIADSASFGQELRDRLEERRDSWDVDQAD